MTNEPNELRSAIVEVRPAKAAGGGGSSMKWVVIVAAAGTGREVLVRDVVIDADTGTPSLAEGDAETMYCQPPRRARHFSHFAIGEATEWSDAFVVFPAVQISGLWFVMYVLPHMMVSYPTGIFHVNNECFPIPALGA